MAKRFKDIIDPSYYQKLAEVESGNDPNAKAPTSSATGLYQFTEGTWNGLTEQLGLDYTLDDRKDPEKSRRVVEEFTRRNRNYLKNKLGKEPNKAELYLSHFLGMGGSEKLLTKLSENPEATIDTVASPQQVLANKSIFLNNDGSYKKVSDIYNWSAKKFGVNNYNKKKVEIRTNPLEEAQVKKDNTEVYKKYFSPQVQQQFKELEFQDRIIKGEVTDNEQEEQVSPDILDLLQKTGAPQENQVQNTPDETNTGAYELYTPEENEFLNSFLQ